MAHYRTRASGTVEAVIQRKNLLPEAVSLTFDNMELAQAYCREAEALLDAGVIPPYFLTPTKNKTDRTPLQDSIRSVIKEYKQEYSVKSDDVAWLNVIDNEIGETRIEAVTVKYALDIIRGYKLTKKLTPGTIKHRIGALRRCFDWAANVKGAMPINPLRLLPERYAVYNETEIKVLAAEGVEAPQSNNERDRRLEVGEEGRVRKVLANDPAYMVTRDVERGIEPENQEDMTLLFELAIETAMRMREIFTLTIDQIDLKRKTIFLDRTKNGSKRQVPLSSVAVSVLSERLQCKTGASTVLFPDIWNGQLDARELKKTTSKVSGRWATIARLAKCDDLRFHDLRHEATARIYERTTMTDIQIAKITGHKDLKSLARYANLRASTLADQLW